MYLLDSRFGHLPPPPKKKFPVWNFLDAVTYVPGISAYAGIQGGKRPVRIDAPGSPAGDPGAVAMLGSTYIWLTSPVVP